MYDDYVVVDKGVITSKLVMVMVVVNPLGRLVYCRWGLQ